MEVSSENLEYDEELGLYLGNQILKVEITGGEQKGEVIEVSNYLTKTHNVYAKNGMKLIIMQIHLKMCSHIIPYIITTEIFLF